MPSLPAWESAQLRLLARRERAGRAVWLLLALAPVALALGNLWDARTWIDSGLSAIDSGQGATTFALLAQQALTVGVALLMGVYAMIRGGRDLITAPRSATADTIVRFTLFAAGQGVAVALIPRLAVLA